jgi:hypothetical protein
MPSVPWLFGLFCEMDDEAVTFMVNERRSKSGKGKK